MLEFLNPTTFGLPASLPVSLLTIRPTGTDFLIICVQPPQILYSGKVWRVESLTNLANRLNSPN